MRGSMEAEGAKAEAEQAEGRLAEGWQGKGWKSRGVDREGRGTENRGLQLNTCRCISHHSHTNHCNALHHAAFTLLPMHDWTVHSLLRFL